MSVTLPGAHVAEPSWLVSSIGPRRALALDVFRVACGALTTFYCATGGVTPGVAAVRSLLAGCVLLGQWPRVAAGCLAFMLVGSEPAPEQTLAHYLVGLTLFWLCLLPVGQTLTARQLFGVLRGNRPEHSTGLQGLSERCAALLGECRARTVPGDVVALYLVQATILYVSGGLWTPSAARSDVGTWAAIALAVVPVIHIGAGNERRIAAVLVQGALHAGLIALGGAWVAHGLLFASAILFAEPVRSHAAGGGPTLTAAGALAGSYLVVLVLLTSATLLNASELQGRTRWFLAGFALDPPLQHQRTP